MGMSVPGNSCRSSNCCNPPNQGCVVRLPGECVYYSGSSIPAPGITTGNTFNTIVVKIIGYINSQISSSASIIPITSADFEPDGITCNLPALVGANFEIFFNDINRFIYNEVGNQEWDYVPGGGFQVLLSGFDASTNTYHLYLFIR